MDYLVDWKAVMTEYFNIEKEITKINNSGCLATDIIKLAKKYPNSYFVYIAKPYHYYTFLPSNIVNIEYHLRNSVILHFKEVYIMYYQNSDPVDLLNTFEHFKSRTDFYNYIENRFDAHIRDIFEQTMKLSDKNEIIDFYLYSLV